MTGTNYSHKKKTFIHSFFSYSARWLMLLLLGLTYEWSGATPGLGSSQGRWLSQFTRPVSKMVLRGARNETSRQLTLLVHYVVEK